MDNFTLQQFINRITLLKFRYLSSFPSDYDPTFDKDTFAIVNTQPSNMQVEHWIMIAIFRQQLYFADSLGCKRYSFLNNQHYKQMMPATLPSHPSICCFYTIYMQLFISSSFNKKKLQEFTIFLCTFNHK